MNRCETESREGFNCGGRCLPVAYICDSNRDCDDGEDEKHCNKYVKYIHFSHIKTSINIFKILIGILF